MIGLTGISLGHFWIGLVVLGVGWNFGFIGATTMVTECHRPNERNRVQSFNDFLVFRLHGDRLVFVRRAVWHSFGWGAVNDVVFPVVLSAAALADLGQFGASAEAGLRLAKTAAGGLHRCGKVRWVQVCREICAVAFARPLFGYIRARFRAGWGSPPRSSVCGLIS